MLLFVDAKALLLRFVSVVVCCWLASILNQSATQNLRGSVRGTEGRRKLQDSMDPLVFRLAHSLAVCVASLWNDNKHRSVEKERL